MLHEIHIPLQLPLRRPLHHPVLLEFHPIKRAQRNPSRRCRGVRDVKPCSFLQAGCGGGRRHAAKRSGDGQVRVEPDLDLSLDPRISQHGPRSVCLVLGSLYYNPVLLGRRPQGRQRVNARGIGTGVDNCVVMPKDCQPGGGGIGTRPHPPTAYLRRGPQTMPCSHRHRLHRLPRRNQLRHDLRHVPLAQPSLRAPAHHNICR
mmetsp:Transcript_115280/g.264748  ORF Transcript_115280/g.264748 Transcript_115280/m.264748 type:complete len:203 (-) Transcript_115280:154-762(-)